MRTADLHRALLLLSALFFTACSSKDDEGEGPPLEELGRCADFTPERRALFGDIHAHTTLSLDANTQGTRLRPADAYRYARGEEVGIQPYDASGNPLRKVKIDRPLDFVAITDHAEFFGTLHGCLTEGSPLYELDECASYRTSPANAFYAFNILAALEPESVTQPEYCGVDGEICHPLTREVWREVQEAAEEAYDRSEACEFTSFVAYEWTGSPGSMNWHRNVIFRNHRVLDQPISYFDEPRPEVLWQKLKRECIERGDGCDLVSIPHNMNLSAGTQLVGTRSDGSPLTEEDAALQAEIEPLVEIYQHKGDSECLPGAPEADEFCGFEKLPYSTLGGANLGNESEPFASDYLRNILARGLEIESRYGVNPYAFGIVASTDTHIGTPGGVAEKGYAGHGGAGVSARDGLPEGLVDQVAFSPGGLAGVWAEENSREAIFEALRRKETFGTSGPRIPIRLFAGFDLPEDLCGEADRASIGYERGVPMGAELKSESGRLRIAAWAGADDQEEVGLERLQIIKITRNGAEPEVTILEVAGDTAGTAYVDDQCRPMPENGGANELCGVIEDPDFDPAVPTIYYARVLQNPTCRWHAYACLEANIDCGRPTSLIPEGYRDCCDTRYPRYDRERAWSSPVYLRPN